MASIDKIYGNTEQFVEFRNWLKKNKPTAMKYLYYGSDNDISDVWRKEWNDGNNHPMSCFPEKIDIWLYRNCPFKYITDGIEWQYGSRLENLLKK